MRRRRHDEHYCHGATNWSRFFLIFIPAILVALLLGTLVLSGIMPRLDSP